MGVLNYGCVWRGLVRQEVGTDRECGYLRCQILHVWVLFPPDYTLEKSPFHAICLLEWAGPVSKKSL